MPDLHPELAFDQTANEMPLKDMEQKAGLQDLQNNWIQLFPKVTPNMPLYDNEGKSTMTF
jgi:hypothetical protein